MVSIRRAERERVEGGVAGRRPVAGDREGSWNTLL